MSFEIFDFDPELLAAIESAKFNRSSKLQKLVIPEILAGKDILASAHSGSGKSASFILPLIQLLLRSKALGKTSEIDSNMTATALASTEKNHQHISEGEIEKQFSEEISTSISTQDKDNQNIQQKYESFTENATTTHDLDKVNSHEPEMQERPENGPRVLVLAPTRELANQISACIRRFTRELDIRYGILVGGAPYPPQVRMLNKPIDFLVATPGRLLDHLKNNRVNFDKIEYLVVNEINRMLDMKMSDDLRAIEAYVPKSHTLVNGETKNRQTLLFADNLEGEIIEEVSKAFQNNPARFELAKNKQHYRSISQRMYIADEGEHKFKLVNALINASESQHFMIASQSSETLDSLKGFLENHSETDNSNEEEYLSLANGSLVFFVHDEQLLDSHHPLKENKNIKMIHIDLPDDMLIYFQRLELLIEQQSEQSVDILIGKDAWPILNQIERYLGKTLSRKKIEGLEPEAMEPRVGSQVRSKNSGSQTKNRNPYSGRRQNTKHKNTSKQVDGQPDKEKPGEAKKCAKGRNSSKQGLSKDKKKSNRNNKNSSHNQNRHQKTGNGNSGNSGNQYDADLIDQPVLTSYELGNSDFGNNYTQGNTLLHQTITGAKQSNSKKKNNQSKTQGNNKARKNKKQPNQAVNRNNNTQQNNPTNGQSPSKGNGQSRKSNNLNPKKKNTRSKNNKPQQLGNGFNAESPTDERDLSWKQYISNISNGNGKPSNNSKNANKKFHKRKGKQGGNFDINHSPMAVSAKKVRDIAKNEEWVAEKKEASKPNVLIRVKSSIKSKIKTVNAESSKADTDEDGNRIGGKLGINK